MKHIYRVITFIFVFGISVFFMRNHIKEVTVNYDATVSMDSPTFPLLYVENEDYTTDEMHGYSSSLDPCMVRENMSMVDSSKTLRIRLKDSQNEIRKVTYEIVLVSSGETVEKDTISAIDKDDGGRYVKLKIKADLEQSREYAMRLTTVTGSGKKIYYYLRLKYYGDNSYYKEKMEFAINFHNATFDKEKLNEFSSYLEYGTSDNSSLAYVTINSGIENIGWGSLKPKIVSEDIPCITEYSLETASIVFSYYVKAKTDGKVKDLYQVREFIRVRYANNRMYLLGYQRTMDEVFNIAKTSVEKNRMKVGITNNSDMKLYTSSDEKKVCFVQEGTVWYYDTIENRAVRVFSFLEDIKPDYERSGYDQHNIQILDMDDEGNIDFMLYGYFNRGDYEGRVGVILYKYYASEDRVEEMVYIPMDTTYQMLKEDLNDFGYLSTTGVYYFTISNNVYAYNIAAKDLKVVAEGVSQDNIILLRESHYMVWQEQSDVSKSKELKILDLEKKQTSSIKAGSDENIQLLGNSDNNIIYGFVKTKDISTTKQGSQNVPLYKVLIADGDGKVLKTYSKKGIYITGVTIDENVIQLQRVKKSSDGFTSMKSDSIINNQYSTKDTFEVVSETSEKALKEYYIEMPTNIIIEEVPKAKNTKNTVIKESTTLQLEEKLSKNKKYYVYGYGEIIGSYTNIAKAINAANDAMGVVASRDNKIVWERGGKFLRNTISNYTKITTGYNVDSIGACISMALEQAGIAITPSTITASDKSISQILAEYNTDGSTYNLTGCTLDEVLYYVSSGSPVIAMKGENQAVLLIGYDEYYVYYFDPAASSVKTMLLANGEKMFADAGDVFYVSY